jgi:DNA-binding CsgD family transcriptional regulator
MPVLHITPSERAILAWLAAGAANDDIAPRLGMDEPEIDACLQRLFARMGVKTRREAIAAAMRRGLVTPVGLLVDGR